MQSYTHQRSTFLQFVASTDSGKWTIGEIFFNELSCTGCLVVVALMLCLCHKTEYPPNKPIRGDTLFLSPSIPHLIKSQPIDKKLQAFKSIKYTGKAIFLSFLSQFFQTVVRWKKTYISDMWWRSAGASWNYALTLQMFSIHILCFMPNFSFKGILYTSWFCPGG